MCYIQTLSLVNVSFLTHFNGLPTHLMIYLIVIHLFSHSIVRKVWKEVSVYHFFDMRIIISERTLWYQFLLQMVSRVADQVYLIRSVQNSITSLSVAYGRVCCPSDKYSTVKFWLKVNFQAKTFMVRR